MSSAVGNYASLITGGTLMGSSVPELLVNQYNTANTLSISSVIADNGTATPLIKNGPGTLVLAGSNTYTGGTTINAGELSVSADANLGSGGISFNGGLLQVTGTNYTSTARDITWGANGGGFDINAAGNSFTVGQVLSGPGGLTKAGGGTLVLTGSNTYTGTTTLSAGTLNLGVAENAGTSGPLGQSAASNPGSIVLGGGYLQYSAANQNDYSGRFSTAAGQQYNVDTNGQIVTWATALTSSGGSLTKTGSGLLTLTGVNTYSGATTITAGTLQLGTGLGAPDARHGHRER